MMSDRSHDDIGDAVVIRGGNPAARSASWAAVMLVEIANYAMLRRHVGLENSDTLTGDIVTRLRIAADKAAIRVIGRDLIEITLTNTSRKILDAVLAKCKAMFTAPSTLERTTHLIEINVGAAVALTNDCDDIRLVEEAECALIEARGEKCIVMRYISRSAPIMDRIGLAEELADAIDRNELFLTYQPKLHVRRQAVTSVEALVRWQHPRHGLIPPSDFIPLAERSRDIVKLTIWTIRQVIDDQKRLAAAGHDITIFINIAGVLLTDTQFIETACQMIQGEEAKIGFEITETSVISDPQSAIKHLNMFNNMGIIIAIDDYGSGLSSLAYLKQLPARELKIDKLFITQLTSSNKDPLIVRSTIDLAHALEMEVVAEGVETSSSLALLSVMGCDLVQGFLISRPLSFDVLIDFLESHHENISLPKASFLSFEKYGRRGQP